MSEQTVPPQINFMKGKRLFEENSPDALEPLRQAAEGGHGEAAWYLGMAYMAGKCGATQSGEEALNWWVAGWQAGHAACAGNLGYGWMRGHFPGGADREAARRWFQLAVDHGVPAADKHLATLGE